MHTMFLSSFPSADCSIDCEMIWYTTVSNISIPMIPQHSQESTYHEKPSRYKGSIKNLFSDLSIFLTSYL